MNSIYLNKSEHTQNAIRLPVAPDNGFGEFRRSEFFGRHFHFTIPMSEREAERQRSLIQTSQSSTDDFDHSLSVPFVLCDPLHHIRVPPGSGTRGELLKRVEFNALKFYGWGCVQVIVGSRSIKTVLKPANITYK